MDETPRDAWASLGEATGFEAEFEVLLSFKNMCLCLQIYSFVRRACFVQRVTLEADLIFCVPDDAPCTVKASLTPGITPRHDF